jgi:hypothetical protein
MANDSFIVEPFKTADAKDVPDLFYEVYGDSYPVKMVYNPEQLITSFESGMYFPFVVRIDPNRIIGYGALYKSAPYEGIYEFCQGAVSQHFRGAGIGQMLFDFVEKYIPALPGSEMYFGEAVCNHTHTQKAGAIIKTIETGIEIDLIPGDTYKEDRTVSGRVAVLDMFRTYVPKPHTVYVSGIYENIVRDIYNGFDDSRTLITSAENAPSDLTTEMSVQVIDSAGIARIAVNKIGSDFLRVFEKEDDILLNRGIMVIQVWFKSSCPWIGEGVETLRKRGYFFGGVFPRWFDEDGFLMQKVAGSPNWEGIHLYSTEAKKILSFIYNDWINTKKH